MALDELNGVHTTAVESSIRDDDLLMRELAAGSGFVPTLARGCGDLDRRPRGRQCPRLRGGYTLSSRAEDNSRPHHMIGRSGPQVAVRLAQTSLYRSDLDLCIRDQDDEVAADGCSGTTQSPALAGQPMRAEEAHQGLGLAGHVLSGGVGPVGRARRNPPQGQRTA